MKKVVNSNAAKSIAFIVYLLQNIHLFKLSLHVLVHKMTPRVGWMLRVKESDELVQNLTKLGGGEILESVKSSFNLTVVCILLARTESFGNPLIQKP